MYEIVPFMLLDSVEAIDSDRFAALVNYLAGLADYLVVAHLPEDASALDDDYQRITEICPVDCLLGLGIRQRLRS